MSSLKRRLNYEMDEIDDSEKKGVPGSRQDGESKEKTGLPKTLGKMYWTKG